MNLTTPNEAYLRPLVEHKAQIADRLGLVGLKSNLRTTVVLAQVAQHLLQVADLLND